MLLLPEFDIYSIAGIAGVALYLGSYGALQLGFIIGNSKAYALLNLAAAACVLLSLLTAFNLFSAIIQIAWILISVIGMTRRYLLHRRIRFSEEDTAMLRDRFALMAPPLAHAMVKMGEWLDVTPGTTLTREGQAAGALTYLAPGQAKVTVQGHEVARLQPGDFIGEVTVMHGGPATATVVAEGHGRIFRLSRAQLVKQMETDHAFALAIGMALQEEAQRKLQTANSRSQITRSPQLSGPPAT
jgi:CRP-like cAMP-binding protein